MVNLPYTPVTNIAGWTRIEDVVPIENGDIPASYVSLPKGTLSVWSRAYVSTKNRGTPKWMVYKEKTIKMGWYGGKPTIFRKPPICFNLKWSERLSSDDLSQGALCVSSVARRPLLGVRPPGPGWMEWWGRSRVESAIDLALLKQTLQNPGSPGDENGKPWNRTYDYDYAFRRWLY